MLLFDLKQLCKIVLTKTGIITFLELACFIFVFMILEKLSNYKMLKSEEDWDKLKVSSNKHFPKKLG